MVAGLKIEPSYSAKRALFHSNLRNNLVFNSIS